METKETLVVMDTTLGKIKFKLYNDTPQHRDNFIKLAKAGQYDGLLFHRVIKDFMVQGGDVTSKDAPMNKQLGAGDLGYTIPAEFNYPQYFHKKGALCAARTGDEVNPEKASSASQFYIVTGKKYSEAELGQMEKQMEGRLKQAIFNRLQTENKSKIMELYRSGTSSPSSSNTSNASRTPNTTATSTARSSRASSPTSAATTTAPARPRSSCWSATKAAR